MLWVALGHFYMYGVFYGIFDTEPLRNRGDAEKVNLLRIAIQKDGHFILNNRPMNTPEWIHK